MRADCEDAAVQLHSGPCVGQGANVTEIVEKLDGTTKDVQSCVRERWRVFCVVIVLLYCRSATRREEQSRGRCFQPA